jgi:RNA polymerase-associated protein LEO1
MSLQLGKELFDVSVNIDNSASVPRAGAQQGAMPSQSHSQTSSTPAKPGQDPSHFPIEPFPSQGLSYLVAQHKSSTILQVEAPITGFLSLRPTGMQSETHRKLVRAVGQKHNKIARLRIAPEMTRDPERVNAEMMKAAGKQRRKSTAGGRRKARDGSAENADEDSDGGAQKKRKRRSSFGRHRSSRNVYSDDEEAEGSEEEEDTNIRKHRDAAKLKRDPGDYEADDFVVEDRSENEDENSGKTPGRHDEDVGEPDELDRIDRQIEHQSRNRRKEDHKVSDDADMGAGSDDMDMSNSEVEEDDDDATTVRKPGTGRKKIVIEDEDEDE